MEDRLTFECRRCGDTHVGLPAWHFDAPAQAAAVPMEERARRVDLTEDGCVIDGEQFFVKGLLEIPVHGVREPFVWGVWLSLSESSFERYVALFHDGRRSAGTGFFGWLCNSVPHHPETQLLKTMLHVRAHPLRPWVELEPTDHPLAVAQREGLSRTAAVALAERLLHPQPDA